MEVHFDEISHSSVEQLEAWRIKVQWWFWGGGQVVLAAGFGWGSQVGLDLRLVFAWIFRLVLPWPPA